MDVERLSPSQIGWRWYAAASCFLFALGGFLSGVGVSERPGVESAGLATQAYYSLGLFVVGGLDIGIPQGGPLFGRILLWVAYFGAPVLTASAVIEAALRVLAPQGWRFRRLRDHIVVMGSGNLTTSYLRVLRRQGEKIPVVVVDTQIEEARERDLAETFGVKVVVGDLTHNYLRRELRVKRARKIMLLGHDDFQTYETASRMLSSAPELADRTILHCHNLRFMRALQESEVVSQCISFNSYNFAAKSLVRNQLIKHFKKTAARDVVVLAGFGRFGQTVLEELDSLAEDELATIVIVDVDANRRVLVVDEQERVHGHYRREVLQGDIGHPEVWHALQDVVDLNAGEPVVILGTGNAAQNLRTALWIHGKWPHCQVFTRTNDVSQLAQQIGETRGIAAISITELVEDNLPGGWL